MGYYAIYQSPSMEKKEVQITQEQYESLAVRGEPTPRPELPEGEWKWISAYSDE